MIIYARYELSSNIEVSSQLGCNKKARFDVPRLKGYSSRCHICTAFALTLIDATEPNQAKEHVSNTLETNGNQLENLGSNTSRIYKNDSISPTVNEEIITSK